MRLHGDRRFARLLAILLVVTFVVSPRSLHAREAVDDACVVVIAHDASAHDLEPAETPPGGDDEHCFVCHWSQSLRQMRPAETFGFAAPSRHRALSQPRAGRVPAPLGAPRSGRAPPV